MIVRILSPLVAVFALPLVLFAQASSPEARVADSLLKAHNYERAFAAYEAITKRDSTDAQHWFQLGIAAASLRRYDRGAVAFAKSTALRPNIAATYNAAAMQARLGHTDSAFAWLTLAVQQGFGNETLLRTDDDLASIRGDKRFETIVFNATHAPTPCATDPERRKFDFWVGEWDVTTAGNTPVGKSSIQIINGGCSVLENWTSMRGGTGKSLNSFNPNISKWQQYWVDQSGGVIEYRDSEWHGNSLSYFTRSTQADGKTVIQRLTFTPLTDSTVRQHSERSTDDGKTWVTTYDFYYHRRR